ASGPPGRSHGTDQLPPFSAGGFERRAAGRGNRRCFLDFRRPYIAAPCPPSLPARGGGRPGQAPIGSGAGGGGERGNRPGARRPSKGAERSPGGGGARG